MASDEKAAAAPQTATSSADPSSSNLVFPSSMLSPKEELSQTADGEQPKAVAGKQQPQIQEEKISSTSHPPELPPNFSLIAPVRLPVSSTSTEVLDMCKSPKNIRFFISLNSGKKRLSKPDEYKPIFDENVPPPKPPVPPTPSLAKDKLLLKTPVVLVENPKDAMALELQQFCYNQPIVLIHGLTMALKIDLSQFSTKTLIQTAADHEVLIGHFIQN